MTKRLPIEAYIATAEALVAFGFDVNIALEMLHGQPTGYVVLTAFGATNHTWIAAERQYMQAAA